jgi:hypothetical protein
MKAMRIANWDAHYETAESRRIKVTTWVATPNGHNSVNYRRLMKHANGMAHFGAWMLILQTASKCSPRGLLMFGSVGHREAHTPETIADTTGASEKILAEAIERLLQIGWLEEVELDAQQAAGGAQQAAGLPTTTGEGRTREDMGGVGTPAAPPPPVKPGERTKAVLRGLGLRATDDTAQEWADLARRRAKCAAPDDMLKFIPWAVEQAKKDGVAVQYAREVAIYADRWAQR